MGGRPPLSRPWLPPPGTWQRASPAAPLPLSPSPLSHLSHAQVALGAFSLEYKTMPSSRRRLPWAPSARLPLSSSCLSPHSPASAGGPMRPHARHRRMPLTWCSVGCLVAPGLPRPARPMLSAIMGYMFTCSQHHRLAPPLCSTPLPRAGSLCPRPQRHLGFARIWTAAKNKNLEERRGSWSCKNSYGITNLQRDTLSPPLPPPPPLLPPPSAPLRDHPFPLRAPLARLRGLPGSVSGEGVGEGIVCEYVYTKNRMIKKP